MIIAHWGAPTVVKELADVAENMAKRVVDLTLMPVWHFARDRLLAVVERRNRIRTSGAITLQELGIEHPEREPYRPTSWFLLRRALPVESVGPDDVFIDFGSGMGRVTFQAARHYPFKRVIGVELSQNLHDIARANIDRNRHRLRCQDVQLVRNDVVDYEVPDDVTVAFFFNPFKGQIFATVIDRLLASVARNPRRLRIVYVKPREHDQLMATGQVRLVKRVRRLRPGREWRRDASIHLYEVLPRSPE
jgi:hypothetical protein